jgi:regulatory protein
LARRDHTRRELKDKLKSLEKSVDVIEQVLDELVAEGLQSDSRVLENYLRHRADQGYGPARIAQELRGRGIDDALIGEHLDKNNPEWDELAAKARRKRFGQGAPADRRELARQYRFLQYRGFSAGQIRRALDLEE